jgi:ketosteroid isomerase-like protein
MLDVIERGDAETACHRLAVACYSLMDQGRYEAAAALFTDDAVWVRGGKPVAGRAAILEALGKRSPEELSRHLVTNVLIDVVSESEGTGSACFVPLRGRIREDGTVETPPITNVGDLSYRFRREGGAWKIAHLKPSMIFKP